MLINHCCSDRQLQNINFFSKYVLSVSDRQLFVIRMPKMCAIPQLISASVFQSIDCRFKILHPNTLKVSKDCLSIMK